MGDFISASQCLKASYKKDGDNLLSRASCNRTRDDGFELKEGRLSLGIRKTFITVRVAELWNKLPRKEVDG